MSNQPAKRGRGRPKGSRNKNRNLSSATVREICDYHKFNPAEKLIRIANNDDWEKLPDGTERRIDWPLPLQQRATEKLFESIHGSKALPGGGIGGDGEQYQLVFVEADDSFALPGEASTESDQTLLPAAEVQRTSVSSTDGQDGVCP